MGGLRVHTGQKSGSARAFDLACRYYIPVGEIVKDEYGETRPVKQGEKGMEPGVRNDDICWLHRISVSISGAVLCVSTAICYRFFV